MPQFRNFFPKRPAVNIVPASDEPPAVPNAAGNGQDGAQRPSLTLRRSADGQPNEYKMSVVNDSGVYLPPSPTEKKSFWHKSSSQNTRNLVDENEPFSISRESFDSYRRSFDISARSPISLSDTGASRTSLDSRFSRLTTPRSTISGHTFEPPPKSPYEVREHELEKEHEQEHEQFVDVGLNEDTKPKKKGFFARFGDNAMMITTNATTAGTVTGTGTGGVESADNSRPTSSHLSLGFYLPGRKREQSGGVGAGAGGFQAAELGSMKIPVSADVK